MKYSGQSPDGPQFRACKVRLSALNVLAISVAALLAAMSLWSCCRNRNMSDYGPLRTGGVPVIRVRLTGRSARTATLGSTGPCRVVSASGEVVAAGITLDETTARLDSGTWTLARAGNPPGADRFARHQVLTSSSDWKDSGIDDVIPPLCRGNRKVDHAR